MTRSDFVVGYVSKTNTQDILHCLACDISKKLTHGYCRGMMCVHERFDNTKHVPMITQKECNWNRCQSSSCDRCVMYLKFGVRKR